MRTLRQILHGCKKHHYVYLRDIKWFEGAHCLDGYKTKLLCKKCGHIENTKIDMMICRGPLDEFIYERLQRIKKLKKTNSQAVVDGIRYRNLKPMNTIKKKPKNMYGHGYQPKEDVNMRVIRNPPAKP